MASAIILAINPGSTSTKIAVYQNTNLVFLKNVTHSPQELVGFEKICSQYSLRKDVILHELESAKISLNKISAVVGRGGLLKPIESGIYEVNELMLYDLQNSELGEHASNLGGLIAHDIAKQIADTKAYIVDPVVVDEMDEIAKITGHPVFVRKSIFHALNQKAVAKDYAKSIHKNYEDLNLVVAHMGGGITVGAHKKGRVVDVNQGLDGEGPFSPERSGTVPWGDLVNLCFSDKYSKDKIHKMLCGEGGLIAHLGTSNLMEVEEEVINNNANFKLIFEAMAYQISKTIGSMAVVLNCEVDAILLTGGMAHSKMFVNHIMERIHKLAPVYIYPGEDEMKALAMSALSVIKGTTIPKIYAPK